MRVSAIIGSFLLAGALAAQPGQDLTRRVQELLDQDRAEEALAEVAAFLRREPEAAGAHLLEGNLLLRLGRPEAAAEACRLAAAKGAGGPAWSGLALALHTLERHREAVAAAGRALAEGHRSAPLHRAAGLSLLALGQPAAAAAWLREGCRLEPEDAPGWSLLGEALERSGRAEEAWQTVAEAMSLLGPRPGLLRARAAAALATGREGEAADLLAVLHRLGQATPGELATLGDLRLREGDGAAALALYLEAEQGGLTGADQLRRRALALWQLGRLEEADRLLAARADELPAAVLVELGHLRLARELPREALAVFARALAREPGLPAALLGQGRAALQLGDLAEAEKAFRHLLILQEARPAEAHLGLAEVRERRGDPRGALAEVRRARAAAPGDPAMVARLLRLERLLWERAGKEE